MRLLPALLIFLTVTIASYPGVAQSSHAKFVTLDPPKSAAGFEPHRINSQGQMIGLTGSVVNKVFLLAHGTYTEMHIPGTEGMAFNTISINNHGQVAGTFTDHEKHKHGFLLSHGKCLAIDHPHAKDTQIWNINNEGDLAGAYDGDSDSNNHCFIWKRGKYTAIDFPGTDFVNVFSSNDHGQMVGYFSQGKTSHGFLLSHGVRTLIAVPGAKETIPFDINTKSEIVGIYFAHGHTHGNVFLWRKGKFSTIARPASATFMTAIGINDRGQIVGYYQDRHGHDHGYLRNP